MRITFTWMCWAVAIGSLVTSRLLGEQPVVRTPEKPVANKAEPSKPTSDKPTSDKSDEKKAEPAKLPALTAEDVKKIIAQLNDEDYRIRDAAIRKLRDCGPEALPFLKKALDNPSTEVKAHLEEIIPVLETSILLKPKTVSFEVKDKPVQDLLNELTRVTGYKHQFWGARDNKTYSLKFDNMPFWQVIDTLQQECNLTLMQGYGDDQLRFQQQPQEGKAPWTSNQGAFRATANNFSYYRNMNLGFVPKNQPAQTAKSESLTFSFTVFTEPRLPLLGVGQVELVTAYDESKNSMLLNTDNQPVEVWVGKGLTRHGNGYRSFSQQASVGLARPSERSQMVKYLKGNIPVTLLIEQKALVVTDKLLEVKGKSFKADDTNFAIEDVKEMPGGQFQVKMTISNEEQKSNPNDYSWQNSLYNRIEVQDEKGQKMNQNGSSWGGNGAGHVQMTITYSPNGNGLKPAKLVYQAWKTKPHVISFEFRDLPLP